MRRTVNAATDLESFAKHGGRSTINVDDVMLLARRNESLEGILKILVDEMIKQPEPKKRRKSTVRDAQ